MLIDNIRVKQDSLACGTHTLSNTITDARIKDVPLLEFRVSISGAGLESKTIPNPFFEESSAPLIDSPITGGIIEDIQQTTEDASSGFSILLYVGLVIVGLVLLVITGVIPI